jgi:hypothetical protein
MISGCNRNEKKQSLPDATIINRLYLLEFRNIKQKRNVTHTRTENTKEKETIITYFILVTTRSTSRNHVISNLLHSFIYLVAPTACLLATFSSQYSILLLRILTLFTIFTFVAILSRSKGLNYGKYIELSDLQ